MNRIMCEAKLGVFVPDGLADQTEFAAHHPRWPEEGCKLELE